MTIGASAECKDASDLRSESKLAAEAAVHACASESTMDSWDPAVSASRTLLLFGHRVRFTRQDELKPCIHCGCMFGFKVFNLNVQITLNGLYFYTYTKKYEQHLRPTILEGCYQDRFCSKTAVFR